MEKTILCYGDSNTWGYAPAAGERFDEHTRWTRILAGMLGKGFHVVEEGLNGRTTAFDDPIEPFRNGRKPLEVVLLSQSPIDLFAVMLGTNDTKKFLNLTPFMISRGLESIVAEAAQPKYGRNGRPPKVLVISPIHISSEGYTEQTREYFDEASVQKAAALSKLYRQVTEQYGCAFLDASTYANPSPKDGIHMEPKDHAALAKGIEKAVLELLG